MDIVERLRRTELHHVWDDLEGKMVGKMFSANPDGPEAADEIERLRGEVMAWWKETEIMRSDLAIYSEQIERQQKFLKEIADAKISGVIGDGYTVKGWLIKHHTILVDKARAALKETE